MWESQVISKSAGKVLEFEDVHEFQTFMDAIKILKKYPAVSGKIPLDWEDTDEPIQVGPPSDTHSIPTAFKTINDLGAATGKDKPDPKEVYALTATLIKSLARDFKMREVKEGLADLAQVAEQDHEVQMARADLYKIAKYAIKLHEMLKGVSEAEGLEGWQQAKITKASEYISAVYHNLDYDMKFNGAGELGEGKSPHKKGSKKYKKHMAAKHAAMAESTPYKKNLSSKLKEAVLMEATPGMNSIGVPRQLSALLAKQFKINADTVPQQLDTAPTAALAKDKIIIRQTKDGWYAMNYANGNFRVFYPEKDGFEKEFGSKFSAVKPYFGKGKSKYWSLDYSGWLGHTRGEKPASDVDSVRDREDVGDIAGGDIWEYANRVFLPKISAKLNAKADEIYSQLRSIPKGVNQFGGKRSIGKSAREAALGYAEALEDLVEKGFNKDVYNSFLKAAGKLDTGYGNYPKNEKAFAELIKEPNGRARFAKTLLDMGREITDRFEVMKQDIEANQEES